MKNKKVEVSIRIGDGLDLQIKGNKEVVQDIIADIHRKEEQRARFRAEFSKRRNFFMHSVTPEVRAIPAHRTKTDIILGLMKDGFFNDPKTISDIQKTMQEKGYLYSLPSLSPLLIRLVRQGILDRTRSEKNWQYVKGGQNADRIRS